MRAKRPVEGKEDERKILGGRQTRHEGAYSFRGSSSDPALDVGTQPLETLVKTISRGRAGSLDVPGALPEAVETELIGDLSSVHGVRKILLVGENEEESIAKFVFVQHPLKLLTSFRHTLTIVRVNDEDDALSVLEIMPPQGTDLVLTSYIPDGERDVLVLNSLDIESYDRFSVER